eukprot:CAMPEP_0197315162 /NCGR_PEP_ID=MMETSP0891-20130614/37029_1 /TAXON_ID=44058 ORGANISM="Aureoumbra lagunensis, Strain CCMP1510" /NCGR_SAMPLE_ID=MMETSP0891 /ASSEMBLY_ACC=CAM_ASM_000534 /LENGTH=199 /DNA_ID=CAMNT_0042803981 /DNA_START=14 /DNA_END=610 /DNA_ORIENTATION=+
MVVNMDVDDIPETKSEAKIELDKAMKVRENLEAEAEAIESELKNPTPQGGKPPGVNGSLVDNEGFPRADVDLYRVRHLRNRLAHIQTDHKKIMQRIEQLLPILLSTTDSYEQNEEYHQGNTAVTSEERPFASITAVKSGSPADQAGLIVGDLLVRYGDITDFNGIAPFTQRHLNEAFLVKVFRPNFPRAFTLEVRPRAW